MASSHGWGTAGRLLDMDPDGRGVLILSGDLNGIAPRLDPRLRTLIRLPLSNAVAAALAVRYPAECPVEIIGPLDPDSGDSDVRPMRFDQAIAASGTGSASAGGILHLPPLPWEQDTRDFRTLVDVVARLRAPDGCPWDRAQTHESLTPFLLEETYEALEEIDSGNLPALREELGDILLQVALHSEIARGEDSFDVDDVIEGLVSKLVRRHPHVFGDATAHTAEEALARWEVLKSQERDGASLMQGVPQNLPALTFAQRVQGRAANVGFDWPTVDGALDKITEEAKELAAAHGETASETEWEMGDLLFSLVNLARRMGVDAEGALRHANRRFVSRFRRMEELAAGRGHEFASLPLEEQNALWETVKREGL